MASSQPAAELSPLPQADGSATFSHLGYTVTAAVNGPIEAQRRDENPFEALVDVVVRPPAGVGGTAERQLESIIQKALRQLIPIRDYPRTVIQVTLQVIGKPENVYANAKIAQPQLDVSIIPGLLHASVLGLLSGSVPLKGIATATSIAVLAEGESDIKIDPSAVEVAQAKSIHVLGFTSDGELLLAESSGHFSPREWEKVLAQGQRICCQSQASELDVAMDGADEQSTSIRDFIRSAMQTKMAQELHWR